MIFPNDIDKARVAEYIYLKNRPVDGARVKDLPLVVTTAFYCLIMFFWSNMTTLYISICSETAPKAWKEVFFSENGGNLAG